MTPSLISHLAFGFLAFWMTGHLHWLLAAHHELVGAHNDSIRYDGRWLSTPDQLGMDASFGGSSFEFSVFNTTSVSIQLANTVSDAQVHHFNTNDSSALVLTPIKATSASESSVSFFHTVNGSTNATYHRDVGSVVSLERKLDASSIHTLKITLPYSEKPNTVQFRGVWIKKGGKLFPLQTLADQEMVKINEDPKSQAGMLLNQETAKNERQLIEVMAPLSLLSHTGCPPNDSGHFSSSWTTNWPALLQGSFRDTSISTLGIPSTSCLTSYCDKSTTTPQQTFFRSGPPNTTLHNHLWPFTSTTTTTRLLLLTLDLSDAEAFLTTNKPSGKHQLTSFIDQFSLKYSSFIQTIRRTAYSPSSLANNQRKTKKTPVDESHLYNSAPSTLPILLILPPLPSPLVLPTSHHLKSLLHHATTSVLNDLKWHIGDRKTILIDTAGWLQDSDFTSCPSKSHNGNDKDVSASDFTLTQSGHINFAYHLSLHLCPYLGGKKCPFEKHAEYTGNLVVPEIERVGRMMEAKRVGRIERLFGIAG